MRRDRRWKIVLYLDDSYGELYDLQADPGETSNLWTEDAVGGIRDELATQCMRWLARGSMSANRPPSRAPQQPMRI